MSKQNYKPTLAQKKILNHMIGGFSLCSAGTIRPSWAWLMNPIDARCSNVRSSVFVAMVKHNLIKRVDDDHWEINESVVDIEKIKLEEEETTERIKRALS